MTSFSIEGEKLRKKIKKENVNLRFNVLIVIVYLVGIILLVRLFNLQIINGQEYRQTSNTRLSRESILKSSRGEILDRTGNVLATTKTTFGLELYKTKTDDDTLNNCLLNLINLLEQYNISYPNNFPINENKEFTINGDDLSAWLKKYKLLENSNSEDAINYFVNKYKIKNENWNDIRKIIALRYEITTKGYSNTKSLNISENVPREVIAQITEKNYEFPGITITHESSRSYTYGSLASHIIGYIGKISENEYKEKSDIYQNDDYVGKTGIEGLFESYLRGKDGKEEIEMSVDGTVTGETVTKEAVQGSNVVLTIDASLQNISEEALRNNIEKIRNGGFGKSYDAHGGAVVAIDVKNGEILSMASVPDYDPGVWVGGISVENYNQIKEQNSLFNKAISGTYAPGSIFKMVSAIAGVETGAITTREYINDTGVYTRYRDYQPKCWYYESYHRGHGPLNVAGAIQKSCNYFFYETAYRMGIDNLVRYAKYFGLGNKTGIELPSETAGILASPETSKKLNKNWTSGNTLQAAIGQGDNAFSPVQMAKYIAMVANGGNKVNPTIIKTILNSDGTEASKFEINNFAKEKLGLTSNEEEHIDISQDTLQTILEGMRSVTDTGGTASSVFKNYDIEVGGKTGSAEAGNNVNAWFAGFAPYDNPEIAVVVMVENGGHGYYTAEVAKEIISEYFGMNINSNEIQENNNAEIYIEQIR